MGLSTTKTWALAVLALACLLYCSSAADLATTEVIHTSSLSYGPSDPDTVLVSGGLFSGFSSAPGQVFMWTVNPGRPYIMSWNLDSFYNTSDVEKIQLANATQIANTTDNFNFHTAASDGSYIYLATLTNLYKVNPADIAAEAPSVVIQDFQQPSTAMFLSNATSKLLLLNAIGTSDIVVTDLNTFTTPSKLSLDNPPYDQGAGAHVMIREDMGYLLYPTTDSVIFAKVDLTAPTLVPVPVFTLKGVYVFNDAPYYYDETNNILYCTFVDSSTADNVRGVSQPARPHAPWSGCHGRLSL
jgi:hypothetical protein